MFGTHCMHYACSLSVWNQLPGQTQAFYITHIFLGKIFTKATKSGTKEKSGYLCSLQLWIKVVGTEINPPPPPILDDHVSTFQSHASKEVLMSRVSYRGEGGEPGISLPES